MVVPGLYSLRVTSGGLTLVTNERHEPEHILVLGTSATVDEREMAQVVSAWLLPVYNPATRLEERKRPYPWSDPARSAPR